MLHFLGLAENFVSSDMVWAKKNFAFQCCKQDCWECKDKKCFYLFEAVTEACACLTNLVLSVLENYKKEDFLTALSSLWNIEKRFLIYQVAKILYLSDFTTFEEFLNPDETEKRIRQTMAAMEYHILKAALLWDVGKFLTSMQTKNFYGLLLENCSTRQSFYEEVNKVIKGFIDGTISTTGILYKTSRKTIIETV